MRLIILIVCMLLSLLLTACGKRNEVYTQPALAEVTCQNLEWHYNKCKVYKFNEAIRTCREGYTLKILECYGSKK